jgi:D-alanyl-D-alanine carboxypeptidase
MQNIPGMVMAVRLADGTVIWDTSGYASPSGKERWSANTPSLIGSITKTFTAVVVMQLVEEGKLSLDDTVDTWFPEQPDGDKITVRMLLSHTSGLAGFSSAWGTDLDKWSRDWTPEELIAEANKAGTLGKPGSRVAHYSNTNYIMLGRIIEKITGNSWEHEIESRIIQPLGLKNTCLNEGDYKEKGVPVYLKTSDGYLSLLDHPWYSQVSASVAWAAGGIGSSASDLMTFASALFDGRLVSKETLDIMAQPVGTGGDGRTWALGGGVMEVEGHKAFAMGGDSIGYHAFFIGTLDGKFIVTALVNTNEGNVESPSMTAIKYFSQQIESK